MCTLHPEEEAHLMAMASGGQPTRTASPRPLVTASIAAPRSLFDVCWDDVLIPQVAVYLSLKDLFNLRCCSRTAQRFVEAALEKGRNFISLGTTQRISTWPFECWPDVANDWRCFIWPAADG